MALIYEVRKQVLGFKEGKLPFSPLSSSNIVYICNYAPLRHSLISSSLMPFLRKRSAMVSSWCC